MLLFDKLSGTGVCDSIEERTRKLKKIKDEKNKLKVVILFGVVFKKLENN